LRASGTAFPLRNAPAAVMPQFGEARRGGRSPRIANHCNVTSVSGLAGKSSAQARAYRT
jgi:hypothetical protein